MNRFFFFLLIFIVPAFSAEEAPEGYKRVKLSEVCFWPEEGESEWIELYNASDSVIDISGWKLQWSGGGEFVFPERELLLEPMEVVVVEFNGTSSILNLPFVNYFRIGTNQSGDVLNNEVDFLTLHSSDNKRVDLVLWGKVENSFHILNTDDLLINFSTQTGERPISYDKFAHSGSILGLTLEHEIESWLILKKSESTRGVIDLFQKLRIPVLILPKDGLSFSTHPDYPPTLRTGMEAGLKTTYQVCLDSLGDNVLVESEPQTDVYFNLESYNLPLSSVLYWRARFVFSDGTKGSWSELSMILPKQKEINMDSLRNAILEDSLW